ncbi:efflux RND transporter periplasmic adaptor subunit [Marinobacter sp. 1_MG-2023]|uniref:efflux RND transporter periplasmic adaptor subunit n=1 Tax=Marinobacter sp. 1_MG-2023 TaxID=3062627 RepID=UPI0026E471DB|nr:HlyD family efflux transporter periplasmic adaptor subunit [Marinobacter sp. 1_MG-2023]MDO6823780.1 efflux RND transporter periplasmic adaptor subunit [Marinobacter sp. 1_MG-2023]
MLEKEILSAWLDLTCKMMRGAKRAVLLVDVEQEIPQSVQWPSEEAAPEELVRLARQASLQNRLIVKKLDSNGLDHILATPLRVAAGRSVAVAVQVRIKPEQQRVVLQLLKWGEKWLELLLRHEPEDADTSDQLLMGDTRGEGKRKRRLVAPATIALMCALLAILAVSFLKGDYRISAQATLEGSVQRAVVAPFDGYVNSAPKRAGETVAAGEILAKMDDHELQLSRLQFESKKDEYNRQYRQALGQRDMAQAYIYKSQISQVNAELNLVERKLERSAIRASMDGYIIAGDLSRSLGAPVELGDVLFEVAPLDSYRLVIYVEEQNIAEVRSGAVGHVNLQALPGKELGFAVSKVSPVFEDRANSIVYRVEAILDQQYPALRPGMQGVAKIEVGERSLAWIYFHELYNAVVLWLWKWLP